MVAAMDSTSAEAPADTAAPGSTTPGLQETHRTRGPQRPENMVVGVLDPEVLSTRSAGAMVMTVWSLRSAGGCDGDCYS